MVKQYESVRLFVERTAFVQPAFALNAENAPAVLHICKRLDGIPLAIELAAARIASFAPKVIAKRLDEGFRLLVGGSRTALPRQQTLQATVEWSYRLLNAQEKMLLCRLSVFAGSWTLEAGEFVGQGDGIEQDQIFDLLGRLASKSLVERDDSGVETRYFLLESIRQFALGKLEERDQVAAMRDRHLDYFLELGVEARQGLEASVPVNQVKLIRRLKPDFDNIRRACDWAMDSEQVEKAWTMLDRYNHLFVAVSAQMELSERLRTALSHPAAPQNTRQQAQLLFLLGTHGQVDDYLEAARKIEAIGRALGNHEILAWASNGFWGDAHEKGDVPAMQLHAERWKEHAERSGAFSETEMREKERVFQFYLYFVEGNYQQACIINKEFYDKYAHTDNKLETSWIERRYGICLLFAGYLDEAAEHLRVSLIDNHALGDRHAVAACLGMFSALALASNDLQRCAKLLGASEFFQEQVGVVLFWVDLKVIDKTVKALRDRLDECEIRKYWAEGKAMTLEQAMAYALETTST